MPIFNPRARISERSPRAVGFASRMPRSEVSKSLFTGLLTVTVFPVDKTSFLISRAFRLTTGRAPGTGSSSSASTTFLTMAGCGLLLAPVVEIFALPLIAEGCANTVGGASREFSTVSAAAIVFGSAVPTASAVVMSSASLACFAPPSLP